MRQSPAILDIMCLRKAIARKSHDNSKAIILRKASFLKCFLPTRQTGVFEFLRFQGRLPEKLRFRDGLMWTAGLTVEIKVRFQISPV